MKTKEKQPATDKKNVGSPAKRASEAHDTYEEENDYGGIPDHLDLKKNLGCGG